MVTEKSDKLANLLHFYKDMYRGKVVFSTAWGYSGMVLLDHARKIWKRVPVVSVDTGFLFQESIDFAHDITEKWDLNTRWDCQAHSKAQPPSELCCKERKSYPMGRLLAPFSAWITAIRRDQAATRLNAAEVSIDRWGKVKLCPMLDWTSAECWRYIHENNVPVQPLHDLGYRSIGCKPCTNLPTGADERSGRWNGERIECGIHGGCKS